MKNIQYFVLTSYAVCYLVEQIQTVNLDIYEIDYQ